MNDIKWNTLKPGAHRDEWECSKSGPYINWINEVGLVVNFYLNNPTKEELESISSGSRFEFAFKDVDNIGVFAFKFGDLKWCDCYFSPNLCAKTPVLSENDKVEPYKLYILLIDTSCGNLQFIRTITLDIGFSNFFSSWVEKVLQKEITRNYYKDKILEVLKTYKYSDEIYENADYTWLLPHGEEVKQREDLVLE